MTIETSPGSGITLGMSGPLPLQMHGASPGREFGDDKRTSVDQPAQPTRGLPRCGGLRHCNASGDISSLGNRRFAIAYGGPFDGEVLPIMSTYGIVVGEKPWRRHEYVYREVVEFDLYANEIVRATCAVLEGRDVPSYSQVIADSVERGTAWREPIPARAP